MTSVDSVELHSTNISKRYVFLCKQYVEVNCN